MRSESASDNGSRLLALVDSSGCVMRDPDGYLDTRAAPTAAPASRSQSLWASRIGPAVYSRVVQPAVRSLASPPGPERLAAGLRLEVGDCVLDLGCGPGEITAEFGRTVGSTGAVVGVDISTTMLELAARTYTAPNIRFLRADLLDVPFPDGQFDGVCAAAVLMLVDSPRRALAEMMRVLRPGGWLAAVVPVRGSGLGALPGRLLGQVAGGRMFDPAEVASFADDLGADRIAVHGNAFVEATYARRSEPSLKD